MKSISIFVLLIYWSIIIFAPVISKEMKKLEFNKDYYKEKSECSSLRYDINYSTKSVVSKYEQLVNEIIV